MEENGVTSAEPSTDAVDRWMEIVPALASKSPVCRAQTWWVGSNVKGRLTGLTMFVGGFNKYREHFDAAVANGYADLQIANIEKIKEAYAHG